MENVVKTKTGGRWIWREKKSFKISTCSSICPLMSMVKRAWQWIINVWVMMSRPACEWHRRLDLRWWHIPPLTFLFKHLLSTSADMCDMCDMSTSADMYGNKCERNLGGRQHSLSVSLPIVESPALIILVRVVFDSTMYIDTGASGLWWLSSV